MKPRLAHGALGWAWPLAIAGAALPAAAAPAASAPALDESKLPEWVKRQAQSPHQRILESSRPPPRVAARPAPAASAPVPRIGMPAVPAPLIARQQAEPTLPADFDPRGRGSGTVVVGFTVARDGTVHDPVVTSSTDAALNAPTLAALRGWRFEPIELPREHLVTFSFKFATPAAPP